MLNSGVYRRPFVGKVAIEAEVLAELQNLISLVKRMISGEALKASPLANFNDDNSDAELMTIHDKGREYVFIDSESNDNTLDNYIELRSTIYPEMAIALPRPAFTRTSAEVKPMDADALAKWREDLC